MGMDTWLVKRFFEIQMDRRTCCFIINSHTILICNVGLEVNRITVFEKGYLDSLFF
jgi:hypothetical protein